MAYGSAAIGSTELALMADDMPILGASVIPVLPDEIIWSETGTTGDTDRTNSDYPISRCHDEDPDLVTKPSAAIITTTWYLYIDLGAAYDVDFCALIGHTGGTDSLTALELQFDQNQDGNFTVTDDCDLGGSYPMTSDLRLCQLDLHHTGSDPRRYTDVQYLRIKMTAVAAFTPELGELIIGRRRQLKHRPHSPFNPDQLHDLIDVQTSPGGSTDRVTWAQDQFLLDAGFQIYQDSYVTDIKDWWSQARGSFVWIWEPTTAPNDFHFMIKDKDTLDFPKEGFAKREFSLHAIEQGPEEYFLARGLK